MTPGADGALAFARFAYPPNELGYCGPDAATELLERVAAATGDPTAGATGIAADEGATRDGLRHLAAGFDGAWPYLEVLAAAAPVSDPLDPGVVEAYWIGSPLLGRVPATDLGRSLEDRFRSQAAGRGRGWPRRSGRAPSPTTRSTSAASHRGSVCCAAESSTPRSA